ncbi:MAG: enoyl-CoA hydratase/isomerase family protein [Polyangiaceae bacterium]|nr:enoyl-CoA hydratase/isomerase family protein [Polyangiaceae bacterium]
MTNHRRITVELDEDAGILSIGLSGGKGNIVDMAMMDEIRAALDAHMGKQTLRMVLLEGGDAHFSFGAAIEEHTQDRIGTMLPAFHALIRQVALYPVPVAALVRGRCLGGAFELVLACHFVFATQSARFACPEIKLGVFPPVLAALGPARLPQIVVERLLLTGAEMDVTEAVRLGFVTSIVGESDGNGRSDVLAWYRSTLASLSASSLRHAVRVSRQAGGIADRIGAPLDIAERMYIDELCATHDGHEGIAAFMQQRKPVWRHA